MRKPEHQWETRLHKAVRKPDSPPGTETFELQFHDGRLGHAVLGRTEQVVDAVAASDRDLVHAVRCWLAARGVRRTALRLDKGPQLDAAAFTLHDLGSSKTRGGHRLVTLAPSNAEVVEALGCFGRVVACEDSSDVSQEGLERLGPDLGPDLDRVAELEPDLVISSLSVPGMERVVTGLQARGIAQLVLAPRSYSDVVTEIRTVAAALGAGAEPVVADLEQQRAELVATRRADPVRVYLEWWPRPMFTPGAQCYSRELIELAGGRNVFGERPAASLEITVDELLAADPEVCFVSWCGVTEAKLDPKNLIERPGLEALGAAVAGRVFKLDERFSGRPGPKMLEASRRMRDAIASCL